MNLLSVFTLLGGLAFFLFGMNVMSKSLEKMSGGKLEAALKKMTSNKIKSLVLGAGITIAIQSSSALTVMLVGFVNSGIMELSQTVGVIMGSNIGTTLTAWILSLSGVKGDALFIQILKPESFAPLFAFIGVLLMMVSKVDKKREIGKIMVGFSILMSGMNFMGDAVSPLAEMEGFKSLLVAFSNPILGIIIGAVFTGIIQSSAASVGILQALSLTGNISYGMAVPIIMGQNIGTCVTALLSSIGVNRRAKQVAVIHISFNVIGTVFFMIVYYVMTFILPTDVFNTIIGPVGIAAMHTVFNVCTTLLLLPFSKLLIYIAQKLIKVNDEDKPEYSLLDSRFINTPSVAITECRNTINIMSQLVIKAMENSISMINDYSTEAAVKADELEEKIDQYEDELGTYLLKLSGKSLSDKDSIEISKILHAIGDYERIGDHALNIAHVAAELNQKQIKFSQKAQDDMEIMLKAIRNIINISFESFEHSDMENAYHVEPLEQVIDELTIHIRDRHIERLRDGQCTIELGFVFSDLLNNLERIADHCSNLAVCVIQMADSSFDTHKYLNMVKNSQDSEFSRYYKTYFEQYRIS